MTKVPFGWASVQQIVTIILHIMLAAWLFQQWPCNFVYCSMWCGLLDSINNTSSWSALPLGSFEL